MTLPPFLTDDERRLLEVVARLSATNPFTAERRALEQAALGARFVDGMGPWSASWDTRANNPNVDALDATVCALADELVRRRRDRAVPHTDRALYLDAQRFALYASYGDALLAHALGHDEEPVGALFQRYREDAQRRLDGPGLPAVTVDDVAHLFALFFQLRRGFHHIFTRVLGRSRATVELRARIWESIFTHDMERYRRALASRMHDLPTLILGPSGSGKELVARAIALSAHRPWDLRRGAFVVDGEALTPLHLAALPPTLVESALFGHVKGAFTGAIQDRKGALEGCGRHGAVFLDEVGEIAEEIQVKLLRVLEARTFSRIGETSEQTFRGKIIAATHRDLARGLVEGWFREDLYYRLCADVVTVPSLAARLRDDEGELEVLVRYLAARAVGEDEGPALAELALATIARALPRHPWPGNVRELDQAVRNILVTGRYVPAATEGAHDALAEGIARGTLTLDEVQNLYVARVHGATGVLEETARRLAVDRRTVKKRVELALGKSVSSSSDG